MTIRVLHAAVFTEPPSGIIGQMEMEQKAAQALNLEWSAVIFCPKNTPNKSLVLRFDASLVANQMSVSAARFVTRVRLRRNFYKWLLTQQNSYDLFLLRYNVYDPYQLTFLRRCKTPVVFVHHTLEVPELAMQGGGYGEQARAKLESLLGPYAIRKAYGIVGVTQEIVDYQISRAGITGLRTFVYPNGIFGEQRKLLDSRNSDSPEFLFVAKFAPWHGLDILLQNIKRSQDQFLVHLVGAVPEELLEHTRDQRVIVHGELNHEQILLLSQQCWVGLSAFALHRKRMTQACPLKSREYLTMGLPVYGDYKDVFPSDFKYYHQGNGNMPDLLKYASAARHFEKIDVAQHSIPWIDKKTLLIGLYEHLSG